jgi:hypothetical protein
MRKISRGKYTEVLHYECQCLLSTILLEISEDPNSDKAEIEDYLRKSGLPHAVLHTGKMVQCHVGLNLSFFPWVHLLRTFGRKSEL